MNSAKSVQIFAINCQQDPFTVNLALVTVPKCLRILVSEQVSDWMTNYTHIYKSQILRMLKSYSAAAKFQYTKPKICEITGFRFFQMPAVISCFLAIDVKLGCADMFSWNWIHLLAWLLTVDCIQYIYANEVCQPKTYQHPRTKNKPKRNVIWWSKKSWDKQMQETAIQYIRHQNN